MKTTFDHQSGRLISCGDAQLYVEELGAPDAPALLMLHGGFGEIEDLNAIAPALSARFRLIGVDSRGHGKSTLGTGALSYDLLAQDLAQVIEALHLTEFSILGFSDGGVAAYRYALENNPGLQKIVTIGASWDMSEQDPAWGMISGMSGDAWKHFFPQSVENYQRLNPAPDFDGFATLVINMWKDLTPAGHPGESMQNLSTPILAIRGDNDPLTTLDGMAKLHKLAEHVSILNIPFAEHAAHIESPDTVLWSIGQFFGVSLEAV